MTSAARRALAAALLLALPLAARARAEAGAGAADPDAGAKPEPVESRDILKRKPVTERAEVKHILIAWQDLAAAYDGALDPRAAARTADEAAALVRRLRDQARAGESFEALMKTHSEDPASAEAGESYPVTRDAELVEPFIRLGLRLKPGEIGVVRSEYGWHVMKRVE